MAKKKGPRQAGQLLVQSGCVEPAYVDGMLAREETMSTYLGNGVSIPHGQFENRSHIRQTGISVLQIPQGVEWEDGEKAYLIIGIAAAADEHVGVLANLLPDWMTRCWPPVPPICTTWAIASCACWWGRRSRPQAARPSGHRPGP